MKLHQNGCRKVVALMGATMSAAQEELIRQHTNSQSHVIVMLDENEAGQAGREDIACRLSKFCFVRVHQFERPDMEPEHLTARGSAANHRRVSVKSTKDGVKVMPSSSRWTDAGSIPGWTCGITVRPDLSGAIAAAGRRNWRWPSWPTIAATTNRR